MDLFQSKSTHYWVRRLFVSALSVTKLVNINISQYFKILLAAFLILVISQQTYAASSFDAKKIAPVIFLLLDDNVVTLSIGITNPDVLNSDDFPKGVEARFSGVADGLNLSFNVSDLSAGQSLTLLVNGTVIQEISSNGNYDIELSSTVLNAISSNTIEFVASPANATWTITQISLFNSEGPFTRTEAVRFLTKATFGANEDSISRLLSLGYETWVDEQLSKLPTLHVPYFDAQQAAHNAAGIGIGNSFRSFNCGLKTQAWLNGAVYGEDQLLQRMAFALSQIFVVGDSDCDSVALRYTHYYDVLLNSAFGNYRDLLENVTLSSAMGSFLSLSGSNAYYGSPYFNSPDENYAREVMQLFSIGIHELNTDGSLKLNNGQPIETYTPEIILEMARALSGWIRDVDGGGNQYSLYAPMVAWNGLWAIWHDHGEKTILNGVVIPPGDRASQTGNNIEDDLKIVLDTLVAHDNVGPFISKQLIQRFVTSNPSPAYIKRVANVFNNNGSGVKGDLSAVIKAILLDTESLNSHEVTNGGKLKEPLMRLTQIWRAFDTTSDVGFLRYLNMKRDFGQRPLSADTVFNFYRPDFAPIGEIADRGLVAPEFYLASDSLLISYIPAIQDVLESRILDTDDIVNGNLTAEFTVRGQLNLVNAKSVADKN